MKEKGKEKKEEKKKTLVSHTVGTKDERGDWERRPAAVRQEPPKYM